LKTGYTEGSFLSFPQFLQENTIIIFSINIPNLASTLLPIYYSGSVTVEIEDTNK